MNLSKKVPLTFAFALCLSLIAGVAGLWAMGRSLDSFQSDVMQAVDEERTTATMIGHFKTQVQEWKNTLLRGMDKALLDKHWAAFQKEEKAVQAGAAKLRTTVTDPEVRTLLDRFDAAHKKMATAYRDGFEKFQAAGLEPSVGDMAVRGIDREPAALLEKIGQAISKESTAVANSSFSNGQQAKRIGMGLMLLASVLGVGAGVMLSRNVVKPLLNATSVANSVAHGNLGNVIEVTGRDETAEVLTALAEMQTQLRQLVAGVRDGAQDVAGASAQITQGNTELQSHTRQQEQALDLTASTMDELGSTVNQTAASAQQANQLAQGAREVAVKGGEVVSLVVKTMHGINDSSRKISEIIGVIDGIAFQTNILALNAAVEAARAGEQGRGFAVVASEVRSLAGRSAEAAKEIKNLISSSVEQVEHGSSLVDKAGHTMQEIVTAIRQVSDIVNEITAASQAQSDSVAKVGEAVKSMHQSTQDNAVLVKQSTAASANLQHQASLLVEAVAVFKLS